jgi:hypothetical protein
MKPFIQLMFLATIIWARPALGDGDIITNTNASSRIEEILPVGSITYTNLESVFGLYSTLTSRQIVRQAELPTPKITFTTHKPLTPDEAKTAIQAALAMNGISAINLGEKWTKLVPLSVGCGATTSMAISKYSTHVFQLPESIPTNLFVNLKPLSTNPDFGIMIAVKERLLFLRDEPANIERIIGSAKELCLQSPGR